MSQPSDKAKWDALAEMLGAKAGAVDTPLPPPRQESKSAPRIHLDLPTPPRKKANWDSLASDLGADSGPEAASLVDTPPEKGSPMPQQTAAPTQRPPAPPIRKSPAHKAAPREEPGTDWASGEPAELFEDAIDRKSAEQDQELAGRMREEADEETATSEHERRPSRRRRRRGQRQREEPAPERPDRQEDGDEFLAEEEEYEAREAKEPNVKRAGSERREASDGARRSGHKSIPSWSEAISIMIDTNLSSRSSRRRTGAGGGRPRGRRGGRRP